MKRLMMFAAAMILAAALASVAAAQELEGGRGGGRGGAGRGGGGGWNRLAQLDADDDGVITSDEWQGNQEMFNRMDSNGDGKIDSVEAAQARERMRQRWQEGLGEGEQAPMGRGRRGRAEEAGRFGATLFRIIDTDGDGQLSTEEIRAFARKMSSADADGDGYVSADEAREAFREAVARRLGERAMERFDTDADGQITREEFTGNPERFDRIDANDDDVITPEELDAIAERVTEDRGPEVQGGLGQSRGGQGGWDQGRGGQGGWGQRRGGQGGWDQRRGGRGGRRRWETPEQQ